MLAAATGTANAQVMTVFMVTLSSFECHAARRVQAESIYHYGVESRQLVQINMCGSVITLNPSHANMSREEPLRRA